MARKALGKGLGALIHSQQAVAVASPIPREDMGESVVALDLDRIHPSPLQPRKTFVEEKLVELSNSIREKGIIQPLIVRKVGKTYELIAGERRWRAAQRAELKQAPVIVRAVTDMEVLELALIENLQRDDLNPIDEADGYARLMEKFKLTQEQVAEKVGKSRAAVANVLRLRSLNAEVRSLVAHSQLSVGHAKALLALTNKGDQMALAREIIAKSLSVRETERLIKSLSEQASKKNASAKRQTGQKSGLSVEWQDMENRLQRALGTKVKIVGSVARGRMEIEYYSEDDLERLLDQLGVAED
ncbi:MAG: ParB/RepB/Spo0J family partition protein [Verrucomicrobiota bacterium]